jgi:hypothetical protein
VSNKVSLDHKETQLEKKRWRFVLNSDIKLARTFRKISKHLLVNRISLFKYFELICQRNEKKKLSFFYQMKRWEANSTCAVSLLLSGRNFKNYLRIIYGRQTIQNLFKDNHMSTIEKILFFFKKILIHI